MVAARGLAVPLWEARRMDWVGGPPQSLVLRQAGEDQQKKVHWS